jgi:hypothetical protein
MKQFLTIVATCALAACGGGGGGGGTDAPAVQKYGVFAGTSSAGFDTEMIALENGEVWGLYGRAVGGNSFIFGMYQSVGSVSGNSYTASNLKDFYYNGVVTPGSVNATFNGSNAWSGTLAFPSQNITYSFAREVAATYNYDKAATLSDVAGNWSGHVLDGTAATVSISSNGAVSGTSVGCSFSGTATPVSSGKNLFNVAITFGASPCVQAGLAMNGIGIVVSPSSTTKALYVMYLNTARTYGDTFFALR